jgi:hypothetical protein
LIEKIDELLKNVKMERNHIFTFALQTLLSIAVWVERMKVLPSDSVWGLRY